MPETFVGKSTQSLPPEVMALGGAGIMSSMFDQVASLLEAHNAPDSVKAAFKAFQDELGKWLEASKPKAE